MSTKEKIQAEIDNLDEKHLDELYLLIKNFTQSKQSSQKLSFMSKLKQIKIDAPEDFAANLDLYVSGEKGVE
ncbi:hypothetical protein SAMD00079811_36440 [Scytonema sp. HK-05]|uniref:hypothetical protein n=1 Tax=Scytonema sp. HK-05 TaxID=1137095 RepID=UPI000936FD12|nr:hypothetical protein [Scytonema sp. HK-05]OKH60634.1 hypothetical protein NIES2130_02665 [Scytonema sp. HK-05]BAY46037.1 hypothetical protein SAMD00079811_36440 [Scytonema sp. HK-05]